MREDYLSGDGSAYYASDLANGILNGLSSAIDDTSGVRGYVGELSLGSFFDPDRPGHAVVRPADLTVVRVELRNLTVEAGNPPTLRNASGGDGLLILHLPPQAITEKTFYKAVGSSEEPLFGPPVNSRIAGESRLVFRVPDQFETEYSLEALLAACLELNMVLPDNAVGPAKLSRERPTPSAPSLGQTAIELPWRLLLSPTSHHHWSHSTTPMSAEATGHTEIWHSRLARRSLQQGRSASVRAVWALSGEASEREMTPNLRELPVDLPSHSNLPFRMPLDDHQRFKIVHLSSNFAPDVPPDPVAAELMVSSLGGWLDARGKWDHAELPEALAPFEWIHRATMGRDHYVKTVEKGFLFPFGHAVSRVEVSEREFLSDPDAGSRSRVAYLRKRVFLVIRAKELVFGPNSLTQTAQSDEFHRQMPFTSIRLLIDTTPNLDEPDDDTSFWPNVGGQPFRFPCLGIDLENQTVQFDLPMIFISGAKLATMADAEAAAALAQREWQAHAEDTPADLQLQRVAFAKSAKGGDTTMQVAQIAFGVHVEKGNSILQSYARGGNPAHDKLARFPFYPRVANAQVRIPALAQLAGDLNTNRVDWNAIYVRDGLPSPDRQVNPGEVFLNVVDNGSAGAAKLDFSTQGDRSGGFIQPNLKPSGVSRRFGPTAGDVDNFARGAFDAQAAFDGPASESALPDVPLPLLFGCIPLGQVIGEVTSDEAPRFLSEAASQLEAFVNGIMRLYELVDRLVTQPAPLARGPISVFQATLNDLTAQGEAFSDTIVGTTKELIDNLSSSLRSIVNELEGHPTATEDASIVDWAAVSTLLSTAQGQIVALYGEANSPGLPAGFRQSIRSCAEQLTALMSDLVEVQELIQVGRSIFGDLQTIVDTLQDSGDLLADLEAFAGTLSDVKEELSQLKTMLQSMRSIEGAPRRALLQAIDALSNLPDAGILEFLERLFADELTIRFDWHPPIKSWSLIDGGPPATPNDALFRANDERGLLVAVEAKVRQAGGGSASISVSCSLKSFDLVLIAPAKFIELNFEKIEFLVDSQAKLDVDVKLSDVKFVGPLSFVEALRDLIPLDGFSDPPYLDISAKGIDAGFDICLPSVAIGVFNLSNLSLGAGVTVPFIGQPLAVRFNFCRREQPFSLTVCMFGGGGFVGLTIDPHGVQILEAALEFGASVSLDFGVASGGVHVMAGIYFRIENEACKLAGYLRMGGFVDVLGLVSVSLELYLELNYESESGKCAGKAELTLSIEVCLFSTSVTIECERKFAGSNGDPTFRQLMAPALDREYDLEEELSRITDDTEYPWRTYVESFA